MEDTANPIVIWHSQSRKIGISRNTLLRSGGSGKKIREGDKVVLFQIIQRQLILGGLHDNGGKDLRRAACDNKAPSCTRNSGQKSGKFHKETESNHKANQADTMHVCNAFP